MCAPTAIDGGVVGLGGVEQLLQVDGVARVAEDGRVDGLLDERRLRLDAKRESDDGAVADLVVREQRGVVSDLGLDGELLRGVRRQADEDAVDGRGGVVLAVEARRQLGFDFEHRVEHPIDRSGEGVELLPELEHALVRDGEPGRVLEHAAEPHGPVRDGRAAAVVQRDVEADVLLAAALVLVPLMSVCFVLPRTSARRARRRGALARAAGE